MSANPQSEYTALVSAQALPMSEQQLAATYSQSGYFGDIKSAAQAVVKIRAARELGFGDFAGLTGVYIVKGRITLSANLMAAAVQNSKRFRYRIKKLDHLICVIEFSERDEDTKKWEVVGSSTFTAEDAKVAGLNTNDTYRKFARNMYFARAMSNGVRWYTPSIFAGVVPYTPDEIDTRAQIAEDGEYVIDAEIVHPISASPESPTADTLDSLRALIKQTATDERKLLSHYKVASLTALTADGIANACATLRAKAQLNS